MIFPSHLQLSFYADHLESFVSSFEHSLQVRSQQSITWSQQEIPQVFTAANSLDMISDKRLIILLWLTNDQSDQEVIGQVNVKMSECLDAQGRGEIKRAKIIMANNVMGIMDGEFQFEVTGQAHRKSVNSEKQHDQMGERRKWANMAFKNNKR